jgi:diguanylate cyclase (GGDEF)-like protein
MTCELCGMEETRAACVPSLVGGHVIGSVLVRGEEPVGEEDIAGIRDAVAQAAPVIDNLRNLARAERRAATDALTGLPNARSLQDTLKRMVAQAGRGGAPLTALMLDLDRFKALNDDFGHDLANDVLAAVGAVLQAEVRASDFAARFGGEEFTILLPDTDREGGVVVAEKVAGALRTLSVPGLDRRITASIGVATFPTDAATGDHLLRVADRALYAAKRGGRDRVVAAESPFTLNATDAA